MFQRLSIGAVVPFQAEALERIERGDNPQEVLAALAITPADLIEALTASGLGHELDAVGPPLLQQPPPRPKLAFALSVAALSALLPKAQPVSLLALRAGLCQVLDFWDDSHEAAQMADDQGEREVSGYWHGIAHRREPDASNASYWFRRVGRHPLYPTLARSASAILFGPVGSSVADRVIQANAWDPFGFIELCIRSKPDSPEAVMARRLQRLEMLGLLEVTCQRAGLS